MQRECCIPYGHIDHEGRLDLVIRFGTKAIIVVEVKKGDADESDTMKQTGYRRWLDDQPYPKKQKHPVLLVVSAEEEVYQDFDVVSWGDVCIEMRRLAIDLKNEGRVAAAAMILAFVAAVEQNLLGFSARVVRDICKGRPVPFNPWVVDHVERFLKKLE